MKKKAWKPKQKRSDTPTLTGTPPLGYLNSCYCPKCGRHLFSYYDADISPDRKDGYHKIDLCPGWEKAPAIIMDMRR